MARHSLVTRLVAGIDWLLSVPGDEPRDMRAARLHMIVQKRPALLMSSVAILLVSATTTIMTGAGWAHAWLAFDLTMLGLRLALSFAWDRPGRQMTEREYRIVVVTGCVLLTVLAFGCAMAVLTGIPLLRMVATISVLGLVNGMMSLWSGVPRLALGMLALTTGPFMIAIVALGGFFVGAVQFLIIVAGTAAFLAQNRTVLTGMLHAEHRTRMLANTDPLTGLGNRMRLMQRLDAMLADEGGFALLYLDLDGFKAVNDAHGHQAGDALLVTIAARLAALVGDAGEVCRIGGDEFVVLLPAADRLAAGLVAQRLAVLLAGSGPDGTVGASLGIALAPIDGASADALIGAADRALYDAKRGGRGGYRFHLPSQAVAA